MKINPIVRIETIVDIRPGRPKPKVETDQLITHLRCSIHPP